MTTKSRPATCAAVIANSLANSTTAASPQVVHAAPILAVARRSFRSTSATPLAPIASLHYLRPVIDEVIAEPPEPGYLGFIRYELATVAPKLVAAAHHQLP